MFLVFFLERLLGGAESEELPSVSEADVSELETALEEALVDASVELFLVFLRLLLGFCFLLVLVGGSELITSSSSRFLGLTSILV